MSDLTTRILSGTVYVCLFLFCIWYSENSYIILVGIFGLLGIWEFSKLINLKSFISYLLLPVIIWVLKDFLSDKRILFILIVTLICSARLLMFLFSKNNIYPKTLLDKYDLIIRYIILPFSFLTLLPFVNGNYHPNIIIFSIIMIWINDSFAYLTGKKFGKRKLLERVSPKKTIEGFAGGLIFTLITGLTIGYFDENFTIINWVIIALIISIFGTLGDLVESKFKRQANVKDSGKIMPGHGGILDRLDSLYFLAPFVYLYIHYLV